MIYFHLTVNMFVAIVCNISHLLQVREAYLRSIVSEPKDHNYVYAPTFDRLAQVTRVVLNNTCGIVLTPLTTPTTRIPTRSYSYVNGN